MLKNQSPDEFLSDAIKQDIAERYFGFRKLIEEDELALKDKIKQHSFILEKRISFDLVRIYVLLKDEELIKAFLDLSGLQQELFYDPYLTESPTIAKRVLKGVKISGFFRYRRFKNFVMDSYDNLTFHARLYAEKIEELELEQGMIADEITHFYKKNDLSAILHFFQSLETPQVSTMQGGMEIGLASGLDEKLHIPPPQPIEQMLTILPPLKPLSEIKGELKKLIRKAYAIQTTEVLNHFDKKNSAGDRQD
jgi:hypothetical protein